MSFMGIKPRDIVKFRTPQGRVLSGRAQALLLFPEHVVVSVMGSRYGQQPVVVTESNYVSHKQSSWGKGLGRNVPLTDEARQEALQARGIAP